MKNRFIFLIGITLSLSAGFSIVNAQSIRITYPIDRMVIHQVHNGNITIPIVVQLG